MENQLVPFYFTFYWNGARETSCSKLVNYWKLNLRICVPIGRINQLQFRKNNIWTLYVQIEEANNVQLMFSFCHTFSIDKSYYMLKTGWAISFSESRVLCMYEPKISC